MKSVTGILWDSHKNHSEWIVTEGLFIDNEDTFTRKLCDIHTKESGKMSFSSWVKNMQQSKQYSYENGSSITQNETTKWSVHPEKIKGPWDLV